jgi:hypothetical protein
MRCGSFRIGVAADSPGAAERFERTWPGTFSSMSGSGLRFDAPRLLAAGLVLLPVALALFLAVPAESITDFWVALTIGPGALALLITAIVLVAALAATRRIAVGSLLDAVFFVGVPLLVALTLWAFSIPGTYFFVSITVVWIWVLLAFLWIGRFGYLLVRRRPGNREIAAWLALPVVVLAAAVAVATDAPMKVRFELSQPAMDQAARDVLARKRDPAGIDRIGLWEVDRAERVDGTFRFLVAESGFLDPVGFAYSPRGEPPYVGEDSYWHLEGPWWVWEESW